MPPDDTLHRFVFDDLDIRGALVRLGPSWRQMLTGRGYPLAVTALLGETTAIATLIADALKRPGRVGFQLQSHGPIRLLLVDCDDQLRLRGVARIDAQAAMKVSAAGTAPLLGDGQLAMLLQHADSPQLWQSIVPLQGSTVAEIFAHFLEQSEQQPTFVALTANDEHACGLLLQKLPGADVRDSDGWNRVLSLAQTLCAAELVLPATALLGRLFGKETLRLFAPRRVGYHCPRDEAKVLAMIRTLGREEIEKALATEGALVIRDEICNEEYRFGKEILERLADGSSQSVHR